MTHDPGRLRKSLTWRISYQHGMYLLAADNKTKD